MKKRLSLLLAIAMVFSMFSSMAFAATNQSAGEYLQSIGVIKGDNSGNLNEDDEWNRQDVTVILSRLLNAEAEAEATAKGHTFADVSDPYYDGFITWAKQEGLFQGHSDVRFGYGDSITNKEFLVVMLRALGYDVAWDEVIEVAVELGLAEAGVDEEGHATRGTLYNVVVQTLNTETADGVILGVALELPGFGYEVVSYEVVNSKSIKVTLSNDAVVEVTLETALVAGEETEVTFEYEGVEYSVLVTYEADEDAPEVVSIESINKAQAVVTFDEAVVLDGATFTISGAAATAKLAGDKQVVLTETSAAKTRASAEVVVKDVKDLAGNKTGEVKKTINFYDNQAPTVVSVEAIGNKKIKVTYSEPVENGGNLGYYTLDGFLFAASAPVISGNEATITLTNRLAAGVHTLVVSNNVVDYAGYSVGTNSTEFVVSEDATPPSVSVVSVSQTELVVQFNEAIDGLTSSQVTSGSGTLVIVDPISTDDFITFKIKFQTGSPLPLSGTEVTFTDVLDAFGNKATLKVNVKPVADIERPVVTAVNTVAQNQLEVVFSEDVIAPTAPFGDYFTVKNNKDAVQTISAVAYKVVDGSNVENKLILTFAAALAAGEYTVEFKAIADKSPLANQVVPDVYTITVADVTAPTIDDVIKIDPTATDGGKIYVFFNEEVDAATATAKANYSYITGGNKPVSLGDNHTVTLLADKKTVMIVVPKGAATITSVTVVNVKDVSGNTVAASVISAFGTVKTAPGVSAARATGKNTVVATVYGDINPGTVTPYDFKFTVAGSATVIGVINAQYNAANDEITLTLNANLDADGTFGGSAITLENNVTTLNLTDIYGNKASAFSRLTTDAIAPEATKLASAKFAGTTTTFVIELSEDIDGTVTSDVGFVVVIDGQLITAFTVAENNAAGSDKANITVTVTGNYAGKNANIKFYPTTGTAYVDDAGNALKAFDFSAKVE